MLSYPATNAARPVFLPDPVVRAHPLNRGREAWWLTLPGRAGGATFHDLMGRNPGSLVAFADASTNGWRGPSRPGGFGELLLDGIADGARVTTNFSPTYGDFTCAFWFRPGGLGNVDYDRVVDLDYDTGFCFCRNANILDSWLLLIADPGLSATVTVALPDGAWHHVVVRRSGSTGSVFADGGATTASNTVTTAALAPTTPFRMGWSAKVPPTFNYNQYKGRLDDVSLWRRALSDAECRSLYDLSRRGYPGILNRY